MGEALGPPPTPSTLQLFQAKPSEPTPQNQNKTTAEIKPSLPLQNNLLRGTTGTTLLGTFLNPIGNNPAKLQNKISHKPLNFKFAKKLPKSSKNQQKKLSKPSHQGPGERPKASGNAAQFAAEANNAVVESHKCRLVVFGVAFGRPLSAGILSARQGSQQSRTETKSQMPNAEATKATCYTTKGNKYCPSKIFRWLKDAKGTVGCALKRIGRPVRPAGRREMDQSNHWLAAPY